MWNTEKQSEIAEESTRASLGIIFKFFEHGFWTLDLLNKQDT